MTFYRKAGNWNALRFHVKGLAVAAAERSSICKICELIDSFLDCWFIDVISSLSSAT